MRENRQHGSEGGEGESPFRPLSKQPLMSPSMNHLVPFHVLWIFVRADWHPRFGLKPWLWSENWGS